MACGLVERRYEVPSGGDWSIHRGAAFFLHGAERITLEQLRFDQVDGNAVMLSNYVRNSTVADCDFWRTGDTAVAAVGSTAQMNGTGIEHPAFNTISGNHMDTVGVMMKQTSCYFKALTESNTISNNICHDGPRAGVNFNDGYMGGDLLEENVIWAMVRETGDHGTFNSWDRREFFYHCPSPSTAMCFMPQTHTVRGNMFIGPAGWNMDHEFDPCPPAPAPPSADAPRQRWLERVPRCQQHCVPRRLQVPRWHQQEHDGQPDARQSARVPGDGLPDRLFCRQLPRRP